MKAAWVTQLVVGKFSMEVREGYGKARLPNSGTLKCTKNLGFLDATMVRQFTMEQRHPGL